MDNTVDDEGEYWFEIKLTNDRLLSISTITSEQAEETHCDFCDGFGYYLRLWETINGKRKSRVLAKVVSQEAAEKLWTLLKSQEK